MKLNPAQEARTKRRRRRRVKTICAAESAFSLVELQVALVVLGLAFTGIFPLVVMQSRGLRTLESQYAIQGQWVRGAVNGRSGPASWERPHRSASKIPARFLPQRR